MHLRLLWSSWEDGYLWLSSSSWVIDINLKKKKKQTKNLPSSPLHKTPAILNFEVLKSSVGFFKKNVKGKKVHNSITEQHDLEDFFSSEPKGLRRWLTDWVEQWLWKHEEPGSNAQCSGTRLSIAAHICKPSLRSHSLLVSQQTWPKWQALVQWETLTQGNKERQ